MDKRKTAKKASVVLGAGLVGIAAGAGIGIITWNAYHPEAQNISRRLEQAEQAEKSYDLEKGIDEALRNSAISDPAPSVRETCVKSLENRAKNFEDLDAVSALESVAKQADAKTKKLAVEALRRLANPEPLLRQNDPNAKVI